MPVGGYCYSGDVRECFYENKLKEVEVSAVAGVEPTPQLEPRQDGGWSGCSGGLTSTRLESEESHMAGVSNVRRPKGIFFGEEARFGGWRGARRKRGRVGCNEVALSVNSWSQGHKVLCVCVHKRRWNSPLHNTTTRQRK